MKLLILCLLCLINVAVAKNKGRTPNSVETINEMLECQRVGGKVKVDFQTESKFCSKNFRR